MWYYLSRRPWSRPGGASYNLTDVASEILVVDHAMPADAAPLAGAASGLASPGASLSLSDNPNPNALTDSCNRRYI